MGNTAGQLLTKKPLKAIQGRQLAHLDTFSIERILNFLPTQSIHRLLVTGNRLLDAKVQPQITALTYSYHRLELVRRYGMRVTPRTHWPWPYLLDRPLPLLSHLELKDVSTCLDEVRFNHLPKTITSLALNNVHLLIDGVKQVVLVVFDLPNLRQLKIHNTDVFFRDITNQRLLHQFWILPSIANSPCLTKLEYVYSNYHEEIAMRALVRRPTLEDLTVLYTGDYSSIEWSENLHTLTLLGDYCDNLKRLPPTLTSLTLSQTHNYRMFNWLKTVPIGLLHLELTHCDVNDDLIVAISRFTQLQSLIAPNVIQNHFSKIDLLPRSLVTVSDIFAYHESYWPYLPANVQLINTQAPSEHVHLCPTFHNAEFTPYVPISLRRIHLDDVPLPVPMLSLERVWITSYHPDYDLEKCVSMLKNIPQSLSFLSVAHSRASSLAWLDCIDVINNSFPNLTHLYVSLSGCSDIVSPAAVRRWLNAVPRTLTELQLQLFGRPKEITYILDMDDVVLPKHLVKLSITCNTFAFTLPKMLPPNMQSVHMTCFSFTNVLKSNPVGKWPISMRKILLIAECIDSYATMIMLDSFERLTSRVHRSERHTCLFEYKY